MFFLKLILSTLIILININSISKAETLTFPTNLVANTTNFVLFFGLKEKLHPKIFLAA